MKPSAFIEPGIISGRFISELSDTHGIPIEMSCIICAENGWFIDWPDLIFEQIKVRRITKGSKLQALLASTREWYLAWFGEICLRFPDKKELYRRGSLSDLTFEQQLRNRKMISRERELEKE